jgi:hypothetical protein
MTSRSPDLPLDGVRLAWLAGWGTVRPSFVPAAEIRRLGDSASQVPGPDLILCGFDCRPALARCTCRGHRRQEPGYCDQAFLIESPGVWHQSVGRSY